MAGPVSGSKTGTTTQPGNSRVIRLVVIILLAIVVLVGIVVLITWLAIKPKKLVYSLEAGKVEEFNLHYSHLNDTFGFVFRAYNPNKRVSVYYDSIDVSVSYDDAPIAYQTLQPFFQPRKNVTRLEVNAKGHNVALEGSVPRDLRLEKSSGQVELEVRLKARIRFKVGRWKSSHYNLRVKCERVQVHLSSKRTFGRTDCEVDT